MKVSEVKLCPGFINDLSMKSIARGLGAVVSAVVFILLLCCLRTYLLITFQTKPPIACKVDESEGFISVDEKSWLHFKTALRFKTVSTSTGNYNRKELKEFQKYLIESKLLMTLSAWACVELNKMAQRLKFIQLLKLLKF